MPLGPMTCSEPGRYLAQRRGVWLGCLAPSWRKSYYLPKQGKAVPRYERAAFKAGCKEMETIATNGRASLP